MSREGSPRFLGPGFLPFISYFLSLVPFPSPHGTQLGQERNKRGGISSSQNCGEGEGEERERIQSSELHLRFPGYQLAREEWDPRRTVGLGGKQPKNEAERAGGGAGGEGVWLWEMVPKNSAGAGRENLGSGLIIREIRRWE